jgi:hypothetical protein
MTFRSTVIFLWAAALAASLPAAAQDEALLKAARACSGKG